MSNESGREDADVVGESSLVEPSPPMEAVPPAPQKPARKWRRFVIAIACLVVASWIACGVLAARSCSSVLPGSAGQTAAQATAQAYLGALSAHEWSRVYELSDPVSQESQSAADLERVFTERADMFDFESAQVRGQQYHASMAGGDRMRLTGTLVGRSATRRTFVLDLHEQPDGTWRVLRLHVNLDLTSRP